jgi:membrane protein DedA with SNARE-associated domain
MRLGLGASPVMIRRHHAVLLAAGALALAFGLVALVEGDLREAARDAATLAIHLWASLGPLASFVALYLEESGVPLPVSGDALVVYLGHHFAGAPARLAAAWLGLVLTAVAGSSNLYLVARYWGRPLVEGRLGPLLHIPPARLAAAERHFNRWGVLAIVFGRHILGFRVVVTVAAGLFRVPYRVFAPSVAISTAPWAAAWLWLGVTFGDQLVKLLHVHHWAYLILPLGPLVVIAISLYTGWQERRRPS